MTRGSARREIPRADPPDRRRVLGVGGAVGLTVVLGFGLTGCADSAALGLVRQACQHVVDLPGALPAGCRTEPDAARAAADRARAAAQLQTASPLAAEAAGQAPQWQALMATLAESDRLPESDLVQRPGRAVRRGRVQRRAGATAPAHGARATRDHRPCPHPRRPRVTAHRRRGIRPWG